MRNRQVRAQTVHHFLLEVLVLQLISQHLTSVTVPGLVAKGLNGGPKVFNATPQATPTESAPVELAGPDLVPGAHERPRAVTRRQRRKIDVFHVLSV